MLMDVEVESCLHPICAHRPLVHTELCMKCGTCASFCRNQCIEQNGHGYYVSHPERCVGCGICAQVCPQNAIEIIAISGIAVMA